MPFVQDICYYFGTAFLLGHMNQLRQLWNGGEDSTQRPFVVCQDILHTIRWIHCANLPLSRFRRLDAGWTITALMA